MASMASILLMLYASCEIVKSVTIGCSFGASPLFG